MMERAAFVLSLERILPAPRLAAFRALTDPAQLARWWGPRGFTVPRLKFRPRVGDAFEIAMQPTDGDLFHLRGEFTEVDPPGRLAFTFRWDPPHADDRQTLATLSLEDRGGQTGLRLVQSGFATAEREALHRAGWTDSFDKLQELLRSGQYGQQQA